MNFVRIFGDEDCLLSVHYDDKDYDEFSKIFDQWTDVEYLEDFFTAHEIDLNRPYWDGITIEQAIIETRHEAIKFRKFLKKLSKTPKKVRISKFISFFKPLEKTHYNSSYLNKKKAYGLRNKTWLRIYALKVGDDMYIITGGTIKLTDNMAERPHTFKELSKLNTCKQFLRNEGIIDEEGIIELLEL
ncbi:MAG: hypothetical protein HQ543_04535 [Bacteroidetes bacterium]|nr:hypothetical protein [Bacteroidota bacterium]